MNDFLRSAGAPRCSVAHIGGFALLPTRAPRTRLSPRVTGHRRHFILNLPIFRPDPHIETLHCLERVRIERVYRRIAEMLVDTRLQPRNITPVDALVASIDGEVLAACACYLDFAR